MRFEKDKLMEYVANDLTYVQKFAEQAYRHQRLDKHDLDIIATNKPYKVASIKEEQSKSFKIRR